MRLIAIFIMTMVSIGLIGCSKSSTSSIAQANAAGAADSEDTAPASDNACGLLTLSEVRNVLPEAAKAVHKDNLVDQGIDGCGWYVASGKYPVLELSVWQVSGSDDTPMSNAETLAMGFADPLRSDAQRAIRIEKITGVGEDSVAIVEKIDAARGIMTTGAMLTFQKNGKIATVATSQLAERERPTALEQLAALGKAVARRL
jgi:hypothetical protein